MVSNPGMCTELKKKAGALSNAMFGKTLMIPAKKCALGSAIGISNLARMFVGNYNHSMFHLCEDPYKRIEVPTAFL